MGIKDILNLFPNPFSKKSTLSDTVKKGELIKDTFNLIAIIQNVLGLLIVGVVLIIFFKIPISIIIILIGTEILIIAINGYITIRKLKSISTIETQNNAKSYRTILITREYYDLVKTIVGVVAHLMGLSLIFLFFFDKISHVVIENLPAQFQQSNALKYLVFMFVIFKLFDFIIKLFRYNCVYKLKDSDDFAQINQEYQLINKKLEAINFFPAMSVFLLFFFLMGVPLYAVGIFGGFMLLMLALTTIELQRMKRITFDNKGIDASVVQHAIIEYQNEQITGSLFGITKTATSFKDMFKPYGSSWLGSGKYYYPENTLLLSTKRLLFIQIPISGGNKIVGNADYAPYNFVFNRGELRQKGEEILKTNSLSGILKLATNDVLYEDIKTLTLKQFNIKIEKTTGEKLSYCFLDKEYNESLNPLFTLYLKERFIDGKN